MKDILVDGYNVIKNNTMFRALETKSLAESRRLLIRQLHNRYRFTTHRVIVVFDGDGAQEQVSHDEHIRIIFSRQGETADAVIKRLAAEAHSANRKVEMYSDDSEIQQHVAEQGGNIQTTQRLVKHLTAAPRDVALRSAHRQAMRRAYGLDPRYKYEEDDYKDPYRTNGKKTKKSSRRGRR